MALGRSKRRTLCIAASQSEWRFFKTRRAERTLSSFAEGFRYEDEGARQIRQLRMLGVTNVTQISENRWNRK